MFNCLIIKYYTYFEEKKVELLIKAIDDTVDNDFWS